MTVEPPATIDIPGHKVPFEGGIYLTLWPAEFVSAEKGFYHYVVGAKDPRASGYATLHFELTPRQLSAAAEGRNVWPRAYFQAFPEPNRPRPLRADTVEYERRKTSKPARKPQNGVSERQRKRESFQRIAFAPRESKITIVEEGRAKGIPMAESGFVPASALQERNSKRSARSRAMDSRRRSKKVIRLPATPLQVASWWHHPERSDIEGIDTPAGSDADDYVREPVDMAAVDRNRVSNLDSEGNRRLFIDYRNDEFPWLTDPERAFAMAREARKSSRWAEDKYREAWDQFYRRNGLEMDPDDYTVSDSRRPKRHAKRRLGRRNRWRCPRR